VGGGEPLEKKKEGGEKSRIFSVHCLERKGKIEKRTQHMKPSHGDKERRKKIGVKKRGGETQKSSAKKSGGKKKKKLTPEKAEPKKKGLKKKGKRKARFYL